MTNLTLQELDTITLNHGEHESPDDGHCLLEVVSMFAGEPFGDSPACVDPVLAAFGRAWNDGMRSDEERAQLKQYIPRLPGTNKGPELSQKRGWMAADWFIRTCTPAWLAINPSLAHHAETLMALPPITCVADLQAAHPKLDAARKDAAAVQDAVQDAAGDAVQDAVQDAAEGAVQAAAWDAVWDAAGAATVTAGWAAAWGAAGAAALAVAGVAAGDALESIVKHLQASAHELFSRMIDME